jgi:Zn-dependent protease with chaperone function
MWEAAAGATSAMGERGFRPPRPSRTAEIPCGMRSAARSNDGRPPCCTDPTPLRSRKGSVPNFAVDVALALVPGLFAAWSGIRLVRHLDDPSLPDFLAAHRNRVAAVFALVVVGASVFRSTFSWSMLAVAGLGVMLGGFDARRRVFGERWSFPAYLSHQVRLVTGLFGAWFPLFLLPGWLVDDPSRFSASSVAFVGLVTGWSLFGSTLLLLLLGARRLRDATLAEAFREVVRRSRIRAAKVFVAGPRKGRFATAFAIPTPWARSVLLSKDLVRELEPRELVAIFAHEVGHLEEFTPARWFARVSPPVLLAAALVLLLWWIGPATGSAHTLAQLWPLLCLVASARALRGMRVRETRSDLRAVELTEDPEALEDALVRLHALNRHPRRVAWASEARQTHPSLARRIQSVRALRATTRSGRVPPTSGLLVRAHGSGGRVVRLLPDRVVWLTGVPDDSDLTPREMTAVAASVDAVAYSDLCELRIEAPSARRRVLVATERDGTKHSVKVQPDDTFAIQAFLDQVDHKLSRVPPSIQRPWYVSGGIARLLAGLTLAVGVLAVTDDWGTLVAPLAAAVWPIASTLALAGTVAVLSFVFNVLFDFIGPWGATWVHGQVVLGLALLTLALAWTRRGSGSHLREERLVLFTIVLVAAVGVAIAAYSFIGPGRGMRLHVWARGVPTAALLLAGSGVGLFTLRSRRGRLEGWFLILFAMLCVLPGASWFRTNMADDPLRAGGEPLDVERTTLEPLRAYDVDGWVSHIRLSPSGLVAVAIAPGTAGRDDLGQIRIESGSSLVPLVGRDLAWIDDSGVMVLAADSGGWRVTSLNLSARDWGRSVRVPPMTDPSLAVEGSRWTVWSIDVQERRIESTTGSREALWLQTRSWDLPDGARGHPALGPVDPATALLVVANESRHTAALPEWLPPLRAGGSSVWRVDQSGVHEIARTSLDLRCPRDSLEGAVCHVGTPSGTELWRVEAQTSSMRPLGIVLGWRGVAPTSAGRVLAGQGTHPMLIDLDPIRVRSTGSTGSTHRLPLLSDLDAATPTPWRGWVHAIAYDGQHLAVASGSERAAKVQVFRVR